MVVAGSSPIAMPAVVTAQLVHLIDQRPDGVHSFLGAGDLWGNEYMERAIRVQRRHRVRGNGVFGHHVHRYFHAVLPILHLTGGQFFLKLASSSSPSRTRDFQFEGRGSG